MKNSYTHLASAGVFLLVALSAYYFWYATLGSMSDEVGSLTAQTAAARANAAEIIVAQGELAGLSDEEGAIKGYFVNQSDIVPFLEGLQSLGAGAGAKVTVVSVAAAETPRPHLDLALKITGNFDAVVRAVGAVEYAPHDLRTKTLSLDSSAGTGSTTSWAASLALTVGLTATSTSP
jgi:hypothetical protein